MRTTRIGVALVAGACAVLAPLIGAAQAGPREARTPSSAPASPQDRTFLMTAIMGDNAQITLGQMAEKGGPAINDFGVMLVQERNRARDQANQLAKAEGMTASDQPSEPASREQAKLDKLSGPQFNYAFVKYMITADRTAIRAYRREALRRGPVAELARSTLPSLQKQLRVAVGLAQQGS